MSRVENIEGQIKGLNPEELRELPANIRALADRAFALLKADPYHPSLHFKKVDNFWSARIGIHYRALGIEV
jgi:hypothetical protein